MLRNREEIRKIKKNIGNVRIIISNSPGIQPNMLKTIANKLECVIIRMFGNHLCGVFIISNELDKDFTNAGGPIPGLEVSLNNCDELRLSTKELNDEGKPLPKGILFAKGLCVSFNSFNEFQSDSNERGFNTGLIFERNYMNGSMSFLGCLEYAFCIDNYCIIPECIEGVYLLTQGIKEIFVYNCKQILTGVAVIDNSFTQESFLTVESSLRNYEKVTKWHFVDYSEITNLPYFVSRNIIYKLVL